MYKILIVDDDPNIRIGLSQMIQHAYPDTVLTDTAENGKIAFEHIIKFNFDIIITDIKMPVWSGLDLLKHLKEEHHLPPTLVLSGYDDYNLVRNSLKFGAIDYLLKPVNEGFLLNALESIMNSLALNVSEPPAVEANLEQQILLESFLGSAPVNERKEEFLIHYSITEDTLCYALYVDMSHGLYSGKKIIQNYIESCFKSCFSPMASYCSIYGEMEQYWVLLLFEKSVSADHTVFIDNFLKELQKNKLLISTCDKPLALKDLSFLKAQCLRGFERYFFDLNDISITPELGNTDEKKLLDQSIAALAKYDYSETICYLSELFRLFNYRRPSLSHLRRILSNAIYDLMERNPHFIPVISECSLTDYDIWAQIENTTGLKELQSIMFSTLNYYVEKAVDTLNNKEDFVIKKAKEYITNNYNDAITLNDISAYVYLNPNYFSTLFKNKTGTTFRHYLRNFRIQAAKNLIRQGHLKIYEIASAVGYPEPAHFVRAFKEVEGVSPTEYKNHS